MIRKLRTGFQTITNEETIVSDPKVFLDIVRTEDSEGHPSIHAGYNDSMTLEVDEGTLAGRTDDGRGPAKAVSVEQPLTFIDNTLGFDGAEYEDQLGALEEAIDAVMVGNVATYPTVGSFPTPSGLAPGKTALGFNRETNQLMVWDPDGAEWLPV